MSDPVIELLMLPTAKRDRYGLIEFDLSLRNNGKAVDRVIVSSGQPNRQELVHPAIDYPGSLRPLPEGCYRIGNVEHNPNGWGPGLGNWWVDLIPVKPANSRSAFGIHLDANISRSPGSAGCVTPATADRLDRVLKWIEAKNRPTYLFADYGKGYLKQIGFEPQKPQQSTPPAQPPAPTGDRWSKALAVAKPKGCSDATARQDGLSRGGFASSQQMARNDLNRIRQHLPAITQACRELGLSVPVACGLASRETRGGNTALLVNGWGDRGNAFGLLQVDRRYHQIVTEGGPFGVGHCRQALGIFKQYLQQVEASHRTWPDWAILQGGCVAYNSGVGNVQSIDRMDIGSTGNDYGSDVLARAQFYAAEL